MDFETREIKRMELKDKKEKKKKKKSKVATFFIILLLFMNIGLLGYIAYDKGIAEDLMKLIKKKDAKEDLGEIEEDISLKDEEVNTLYSYLIPIKEKLVMNDNIAADSFTQEEKIAFALSLLKEENFEKIEGEESTYKLKPVFLEEASEMILGENAQIENRNLKTPYYEKYSKNLEGNMTLTYNEIENSYIVSVQPKKENVVEPFYTKLQSAKKKGNKLTITEKVIYTLVEDEGIKIYSNWQLSSLLDNVDNQESLQPEKIEEYIEKGSEVSYTFEKVKGNYRFISSEIKEKN